VKARGAEDACGAARTTAEAALSGNDEMLRSRFVPAPVVTDGRRR